MERLGPLHPSCVVEKTPSGDSRKEEEEEEEGWSAGVEVVLESMTLKSLISPRVCVGHHPTEVKRGVLSGHPNSRQLLVWLEE